MGSSGNVALMWKKRNVYRVFVSKSFYSPAVLKLIGSTVLRFSSLSFVSPVIVNFTSSTVLQFSNSAVLQYCSSQFQQFYSPAVKQCTSAPVLQFASFPLRQISTVPFAQFNSPLALTLTVQHFRLPLPSTAHSPIDYKLRQNYVTKLCH